jgi:hypothetical protein
MAMLGRKPFKPAWWLRNPHLQTVYARYVGRRRRIETRKELFDLPDGDFLDLRWAGGDVGPIVLVLHGLEGSVESHYAKGMMQAAVKNGWRAVLAHFRTCGDELNRLPRAYHSGDTQDFDALVRHIKATEPNTPIVAVGYSMGASVLLKWLGESADQNPLDAAIAVSVPFELHKVSENISSVLYGKYEQYFLKPLKHKILNILENHDLPLDIDKIINLQSLREYDDYITAPLHGFASAHDYYVQCSSRYCLSRIAVPTLIIHSVDDPFMTKDIVPTCDEVSLEVELEIYERGGHVGFVSGWNPLRPQYWLEHRIPEYIKKQLKALQRPFRVA